ncbi:copper chaperone SCO1/SenC [Paenibacillus sp. 32O-W]|uniref:SCO family protein n=1 Tax=Paenibacillus sp. 32O-W TaxID=1695218 RepID=UPI000723065E|nr:SCO family protein [Paenibacillus sp. 32O-W]ALS28562.1 copper chaperone SCO1/SenC [Paenibacillus sp. 32O-W]
MKNGLRYEYKSFRSKSNHPFDDTLEQADRTVILLQIREHGWLHIRAERLVTPPSISYFIFTYCETVCPTMTANMAELQKRLKAAGVEAELISFSVDPERDDPATLKSYLEKFDADFTNWSALTGYEFEEIKTFVLKSFKSPIAKDNASDQVIHGTSFYLVDQTGTAVAKYDGMDNTPYEKIIKDIKALQR